jgi:hypothetical protein
MPVSYLQAWLCPWAWAETRISWAETRVAWNGEAHSHPVPHVSAWNTLNHVIGPYLKVGVGWNGWFRNHEGRGRGSGPILGVEVLGLGSRRWSASLHGHITQFRFSLLLALGYICHDSHALGPSCALQLMAFLAKSWFRCLICLGHLHLRVEDGRNECSMLTHSISVTAFTRA